MYAPRVFVSIVCVLIAIALASWIMGGSVWTVVIQTVVSAVILQLGYFIAVVYLVRRARLAAEHQGTADARNRTGQGRIDPATEKAATLIGAQTFRHGTSEKS